MVAFRISQALVLGLSLAEGAAAAATQNLAPRYVKPAVKSTWDYPLGYAFTSKDAVSGVTFYSVDLFNTAQTEITALKNAGKYVVCYFSAGSYEDWRPDKSNFPAAAIGNAMVGWPGEKWVDVTNAQLRSNVMTPRINLAKQKGCHGIDPDNIDAYNNDSGFSLTTGDGVSYVKWLCSQAHSLDLSCGLKNGPDIAHEVVSVADFSIVEQCVKYNKCASYTPFIAANKPVFHVEYAPGSAPPVVASFRSSACAAQGNTQFSNIIKHKSLDKWRDGC